MNANDAVYSAYSIHPDQVPELLPDIEAALIRAWNALPPSFELADETRRLRGERKVLHDILRSCADVIEAIDPESEDERERIGALIETVGNALLGNNHST